MGPSSLPAKRTFHLLQPPDIPDISSANDSQLGCSYQFGTAFPIANSTPEHATQIGAQRNEGSLIWFLRFRSFGQSSPAALWFARVRAYLPDLDYPKDSCAGAAVKVSGASQP